MGNFVDTVALAMPWAGSAIPAVMTYVNVQKLGFEWWQALIIAAVVEGIGFVCITTAIDIYEAWMEAQTKNGLVGMFWVAIAGAAVYLVAVLLVNAILHTGDVWQKITLGLLSLFGMIGGVMIALRNQLGKFLKKAIAETDKTDAEKKQADALALERERNATAFAQHLEEEKLRQAHELELRKVEEESRRKIEKIHADTARRVAEHSPVSTGKNQQVSGDNAASIRRWPDVPESDWEWIRDAPVGEIVKKYGLQGKDIERKARKWKEYAVEGLSQRDASQETRDHQNASAQEGGA